MLTSSVRTHEAPGRHTRRNCGQNTNNMGSRCRHPSPRLRWWTHLASLRHPPSHRQIHHRLLPKVRRRALEEPAQAGPDPVRPHTARCRQQAVRAQEVRRSRCARQVPEVLPLSGITFGLGKEKDGAVYGGAWSGVHPGLLHGVFYCLLSISLRTRLRDMARNGCLVRSPGL